MYIHATWVCIQRWLLLFQQHLHRAPERLKRQAEKALHNTGTWRVTSRATSDSCIRGDEARSSAWSPSIWETSFFIEGRTRGAVNLLRTCVVEVITPMLQYSLSSGSVYIDAPADREEGETVQWRRSSARLESSSATPWRSAAP
uniref:Uncharacterized protein n=1 Tax=Oryza punctata TaxID=4537 RepID=A0A0E0KFT0_ORYPU